MVMASLFLAWEAAAQTLLWILLGQLYKTPTPAHKVSMEFCFFPAYYLLQKCNIQAQSDNKEEDIQN